MKCPKCKKEMVDISHYGHDGFICKNELCWFFGIERLSPKWKNAIGSESVKQKVRKD